MTALSAFNIDEKYLAHSPNETLLEHSLMTKYYFDKIKASKDLNKIIDDMLLKIDEENFSLIKEIFENAVFLHDIGKINPYFQAKKMNNENFKAYKNKSNSTKHSDNSKIEFCKYFEEKISNIKKPIERKKLNFILYAFSYHILKHHGKLSVFENYDDKCISFFFHLEKFNIESFSFYILNKLLFSLLISSDYYATTHYMANLPSEDFGLIKDKKKVIDKFESYEIIKNIRQNKSQEGINALRSKMFLEAEENLLKNIDKNIFYLEAPTGSGKTLTSINLAMKFLEKDKIDKIFYVFPFNTLVEQTKKTLKEIFENELNVEVINSISPIQHKNDDEQEDKESQYQKSYMNRLFFHNELILTTHISLFSILFGTTKEENFPLWQLANSVIILDEIQSYDIKLWTYMTKFFKFYAQTLNIKFIIMSATLPKLDELIDENKDNFVELIKNKDEYYQNSLFKNRVKLDFSLLENKNFEDKILLEKLQLEKENYSKILFEFIKKDSAREFYNILKEDENFKDFELYELSGDDNKALREFVIKKLKEERKVILVATQVIEAGIDIDMDLGFKDISTLDSEEQFLGRINRNSLKNNAKVYFFNKDNEGKIYKEDPRILENLKKLEIRKLLEDKDFKSFYRSVLEELKIQAAKIEQGTKSNFENFDENVKKLNYKKIKDEMQLIKNKNLTLFFPFKLDIENFELDDFKNLDKIYLNEDGKLDGEKIWQEFLKLNDIKNYAEKEIKRSKINSLMQFFTFNIPAYNENYKAPYFDEEKFGFYLVKNHEAYIKDGKFDRKKYLKL